MDVDRQPRGVHEPVAQERRNAAPPVAPLALLDAQDAAGRLRDAFAVRSEAVGPRTANRELSALAGAVKWWRARGWSANDPTDGLRPLPVTKPAASASPLGAEQVRAVLELAAPLCEQALWHLLHESGAAIGRVLALDVGEIDLPRRRTRARSDPALRWAQGSARLLPLLTLGRIDGPLFATSRGRLSYRRAAEVFTAATRPLDPAGHGWACAGCTQGRGRGESSRCAGAGRGPRHTAPS